jgi:hypothetical protein
MLHPDLEAPGELLFFLIIADEIRSVVWLVEIKIRSVQDQDIAMATFNFSFNKDL